MYLYCKALVKLVPEYNGYLLLMYLFVDLKMDEGADGRSSVWMDGYLIDLLIYGQTKD